MRTRWPLMILLLTACSAVACAAGRTRYVDAAAGSNGDGSRRHPWATLQAVSEASRPGDIIMVLPAPITTPALGGGIILKQGQKLIGAGRSVVNRDRQRPSPRITNDDAARGAGDAIVLGNNTEVRNIVIAGALRGGIYGQDVVNAIVRGNDLSGVNTSCAPGLLISFPSASGWAPLKNGWAAILVDATKGTSVVRIEGNQVHDGLCSDGIDIRASGDARVRARISRNLITRLQQGAQLGSLLGIGLQTRDTAQIIAESAHNTETYLGNLFDTPPKAAWDESWPVDDLAGADCEGLFTHQTGGTLTWTVDHNTFAHGIGGTSCNGAEFFVGSGAAVLKATVRDSTFDDNPGDMIEENNLGTDSTMEVFFDQVTVRHTTHERALRREPPIPGEVFASFTSRSFCFSQFSVGPGATTSFRMARSHFADCAGDGIQAFYANLPDLPPGRGAKSSIDIVDSSITHVGEYPLHWINYGSLNALEVRIERSTLESGRDYEAVSLDQAEGARIDDAVVDLGQGALRSSGGNCLLGGSSGHVLSSAYPAVAAANWWGRVASAGNAVVGNVTVSPALSSPAHCDQGRP